MDCFFFVLKLHLKPTKRPRLLISIIIQIVVLGTIISTTSSSWLWVDKHAKIIGAKILPWSYIANTIRYKIEVNSQNEVQKLLPEIKYLNNKKSVAILIIGETARSQNFSLYGYDKNTNPELIQQKILVVKNVQSCSTYTTESIKCILSHSSEKGVFNDTYEYLPTFLSRHGVNVIWRSNNWGEPKIKVNEYATLKQIKTTCPKSTCNYDEGLLFDLKEKISTSLQSYDKTLIVLHQKGSHGPLYSSRYPKNFEVFKPACDSVQLSDCDEIQLINAYDNSILYTDHFISEVIKTLKLFPNISTSMIYLSDHGESLGEGGFYLHGAPNSIAPKQQRNIPFLLWMSDKFVEANNVDESKKLYLEGISQYNIFHSILGGLSLTSDIYNEHLDVFAILSK